MTEKIDWAKITRERRKEAVSKGMCTLCLCRPKTEGVSTCERCREKQRKAKEKKGKWNPWKPGGRGRPRLV